MAVALGAERVPESTAELAKALDEFRPALGPSTAARDAADFLLHEPPVPRSLRPGYTLLARAAVASMPVWSFEMLGLDAPARSGCAPPERQGPSPPGRSGGCSDPTTPAGWRAARMTRFLLLGSRAEDAPPTRSTRRSCGSAGCAPTSCERVRMEAGAMPASTSTIVGHLRRRRPVQRARPAERKSPVQRRVEAEIRRSSTRSSPRDFPFLGACYGVGTLGVHQGAVIDRTYAEPISVVPVTLTEAGGIRPAARRTARRRSTRSSGTRRRCRVLPRLGVLLASSPTCPVQMFRVGTNVYATQFHPELDVDGIIMRIHAYADYGYFQPKEHDDVVAGVAAPTSGRHRAS